MDIQENFIYLQELLRTAYNLISPTTYLDDLIWLKDSNSIKLLYDRCPNCFLVLSRKDTGEIHFPLCNRMNIEDPRVIEFSLIFAGRLDGNDNIDMEELKQIIEKLKRIKNRFSKPIPKTMRMAALKAKTTRQFTNIKNYLNGK